MNGNTRVRPADVPSPEDALDDERCRRIVRILSKRNAPISVTELATAVGASEPGSGSDGARSDATDEIRTALHHVHLPKLDHANVVDYDPRTHTVIPLRVEDLASDHADILWS